MAAKKESNVYDPNVVAANKRPKIIFRLKNYKVVDLDFDLKARYRVKN